jgi:hypothetical protein
LLGSAFSALGLGALLKLTVATIAGPAPASASTPPDTGRELAEIGVRLLDDAYMSWCTAAIASEDALHAWSKGSYRGRDDAYRAYRAALEREDAAARDLQRLSELTRPCRQAFAAY